MSDIRRIILETFTFAKKYGAKDIILLYCVSSYPADYSEFNINNIRILKEKFKCKVGLSDHSKDNNIAKAAIAVGAEYIEKHIALDNQKSGLDLEFSLKGKEIKTFVKDIKDTYELLGKKSFSRNKNELKMRKFRRSIFAVKDINKGEKFSSQNLRRIRPGYGLEPKYYTKLMNKVSPINIKAEEPLPKELIKKLKI